MDASLILMGGLASLAAGLATAIGAVPVLLVRSPSQAMQDTFLGFAAGGRETHRIYRRYMAEEERRACR